MKTAISQLSTSNLASSPERQGPVSTPLNGEQVGQVFKRLQAQLGAKLADLYAGVKPEDVRQEWAAALGGYRNEEIIRGLDACRTRAFAPNLGEFLNLCRPALDPEIAWMEALDGIKARAAGERGEWSHPAVFRAAQSFVFELRSKSFKECKKNWAFVLQREFSRGWIKDVPEAPLQIPHMPSKPGKPSPEVLAKIKSILGREPGGAVPEVTPAQAADFVAQEFES